LYEVEISMQQKKYANVLFLSPPREKRGKITNVDLFYSIEI
jgi:hypothetical protein